MNKPSNVVLLIDDEPKIRRFLRAGFELQGYSVLEAENAADGLKVATFSAPDLVILDLGLPGGSGFIVLERLKANTTLACIPVIILTADESPESEFKGLEAGAAAFLHKPVQEVALIAAVECAVGDGAECPITDAELQR